MHAPGKLSDIATVAESDDDVLQSNFNCRSLGFRGCPLIQLQMLDTVTLPASASVGDQIIFTDYARIDASATNALTKGRFRSKFFKMIGGTYSYTNSYRRCYDTAGVDGDYTYCLYGCNQRCWYLPINDGAVALETPQ